MKTEKTNMTKTKSTKISEKTKKDKENETTKTKTLHQKMAKGETGKGAFSLPRMAALVTESTSLFCHVEMAGSVASFC